MMFLLVFNVFGRGIFSNFLGRSVYFITQKNLYLFYFYFLLNKSIFILLPTDNEGKFFVATLPGFSNFWERKWLLLVQCIGKGWFIIYSFKNYEC